MTIKITKLRLGAAMLALAMLVPATAWATHVFSDVVDGAFYAASAEWAKTNDITTGSPAGSSTFKPLDGVTRAESVTFLKRYDDNIVQPALAAQPTVLWAKVNSDGRKAAGSAGVTSFQGGIGLYTVDFGVDVSACSWSGVIRNDASNLMSIHTVDMFVTLVQGLNGSIFFPPFTTNTSQIDVWVRDHLAITGSAVDGAFNVQVICT